jgi:hypothetical protein
MEDRTASIAFDDLGNRNHTITKRRGGPSSPLSPILFTFFNSDLVDQPVNFYGGSAFIDDYFRWRGPVSGGKP